MSPHWHPLHPLPEQPPSARHKRAFAVVTNRGFLPGCLALLNSIASYHGTDIPTCVFGIDLTASQWRLLTQGRNSVIPIRISRDDLGPCERPNWVLKQQVPARLFTQVKTLCLLDADIVLLSPLDDVFARAEENRIVSSEDRDGRLHYGSRYQRYAPDIPRRSGLYFNSGFLCLQLQRHWDLVGLWAWSARWAEYAHWSDDPLQLPGHGDQGLLNGVALLLKKQPALHLFREDEWCNSTGWSTTRTLTLRQADPAGRLDVVNDQTGERQRLLHSTGPKWWTDRGRQHFRDCGDVLTCFEHFAVPQLGS